MENNLLKQADEIEAQLMKHPKEAIAKAAASFAVAFFAGSTIIHATEDLSPIIRLKHVEREIGTLIGRAEALDGKASRKSVQERGRISQKLKSLIARRRALVAEIESREQEMGGCNAKANTNE